MKDGVRFLVYDNIVGIIYPMWNRCYFMIATNAINRCSFNIGILQLNFTKIIQYNLYSLNIIVLKSKKVSFPISWE